MEDIIFEHDRPWYSLVVSVRMPRITRSNEEVEEELYGEMQEWNPSLLTSVKAVRILCRPEMLWRKERGSLLVSFEGKEEYEYATREGIFVYGEHCRTAPYRPRCDGPLPRPDLEE
jgi:hypothetical protein